MLGSELRQSIDTASKIRRDETELRKRKEQLSNHGVFLTVRQSQVGQVGAPCRLSNVCVADQPNDGINQPVIESLWRT